jgi:death-on-curing protein
LGLRDRGLLESALAMPEATYSNEYLHPSLEEQAAAYLFHLVKNHPFIDGNKRAGLACCLVFLRLNGHRIRATDDAVVNLVVGVAEGRIAKAEVAVFLRAHRRG